MQGKAEKRKQRDSPAAIIDGAQEKKGGEGGKKSERENRKQMEKGREAADVSLIRKELNLCEKADFKKINILLQFATKQRK